MNKYYIQLIVGIADIILGIGDLIFTLKYKTDPILSFAGGTVLAVGLFAILDSIGALK